MLERRDDGTSVGFVGVGVGVKRKEVVVGFGGGGGGSPRFVICCLMYSVFVLVSSSSREDDSPPDCADEGDDFVVIPSDQCGQEYLTRHSPGLPLADGVGRFGVWLLAPKLKLGRDQCYQEKRWAKEDDSDCQNVIERSKEPDQYILGPIQEWFIVGYWVLQEQFNVDKVADLARVTTTEKSADETLDQDEGQSVVVQVE